MGTHRKTQQRSDLSATPIVALAALLVAVLIALVAGGGDGHSRHHSTNSGSPATVLPTASPNHLAPPEATPKASSPSTDAPAPPKDEALKYTVHAGECLSVIADLFRMSWHKLYALNKKLLGPNPNLIFPGQVLTIKR